MIKFNPWILSPLSQHVTKLNLYCFGHAGSLAGEYYRYFKALETVKFHGIQLPGRGSRIKESSYETIDELVKSLLFEVVFEPPFVFFGHSLGGLIAFELAKLMKVKNKNLPSNMFISSSKLPSSKRKAQILHTMDDDRLLYYVESKWSGLPWHIKKNKELLKHCLAILRDDLRLYENYEMQTNISLDIPVTTFVGEEDTVDMSQWKQYFPKNITQYQLPGGHFYFRQQQSLLFKYINQALFPGEKTYVRKK